MSYRIAICDDEQEQLKALAQIVGLWSKENGEICEIRTFLSAEEFLFAYEDDKNYDIFLLDVEMKEMSGIDLAKKIRRDSSRAEIVFVTSHFEFIGEGYEVDALHYLVKPVAEEKLKEVLAKAAAKLREEPPSVVITCENETVKLYETDILYVESFLHYICIYTKEKEYRIKESISVFEKKLSADFFRIHRSYLVALKAVVRITRNSVTLEGGVELPVARGKYDSINRAFIEAN